MATTAIMKPPSELAGENSIQEHSDPRGTWVVGEPERIEPLKSGSDQVRDRKDETTELQKRTWFCSISH